MTSSLSRRSLFAAGGAAVALALAACTSEDPLAKQANAGDNKNYIAGDGSVTEISPEKRIPAVAFSGKLFDGTTVSSAEFNGAVTVLNFWYAACAPCRAEAPDLEELHQAYKADGVKFYGVNVRDEQAAAEAFERNFGVSYPSFVDKDGAVLLAYSSSKLVSPGAVPTTLVLDKQGRVSARIMGITDKSTLKSLLASALAEA